MLNAKCVKLLNQIFLSTGEVVENVNFVGSFLSLIRHAWLPRCSLTHLSYICARWFVWRQFPGRGVFGHQRAEKILAGKILETYPNFAIFFLKFLTTDVWFPHLFREAWTQNDQKWLESGPKCWEKDKTRLNVCKYSPFMAFLRKNPVSWVKSRRWTRCWKAVVYRILPNFMPQNQNPVPPDTPGPKGGGGTLLQPGLQ